jgi:hypothetical protein
LAIGVSFTSAVDEQEVHFLGGPEEAIKLQSKAFVVLVPGDLEGKEFLKSILRFLATKLPKEMSAKVVRASIESIREFVPYTRGRISPV